MLLTAYATGGMLTGGMGGRVHRRVRGVVGESHLRRAGHDRRRSRVARGERAPTSVSSFLAGHELAIWPPARASDPVRRRSVPGPLRLRSETSGSALDRWVKAGR